MTSINVFKLFTIMLVSALLLAMAIPAAVAEEKTTAAKAGPDISVISGPTGSAIGGANVYLDGSLAGKTDSKGNFTFKEAPAAGNHTVLVSAKGIHNATVNTDFAGKPVVVKTEASRGYEMTVHVADKASKQGIAGVTVLNGKYVMGATNASGDLALNSCPMGLYLVKFEKDGYKSSTSLLIVYASKTQSFTLTPSK